MKRESDRIADAIVVGAGLNGAWAAKELSEAGLRVCLLDAGRILNASEVSADRLRNDIFNLSYHIFRLKLLLKGDTQRAFSKFVSSQTAEYFLDRGAHPYVTDPNNDFTWLRVRAIGGRGHLWGRVMLRITDTEFKRPGSSWPITYADLVPFYSEVERGLEMGGARSTMPTVPDGEYVHSRSLHPLEQQFCESVCRRWPERQSVVNHVAQYEPSPFSPPLRAALRTGRTALHSKKLVTGLEISGTPERVVGVRVQCLETGQAESFRARFVLLAASAFETVRLLFNSYSERFSKGVGNENGLLGTRILEHIVASYVAELPRALRSSAPLYSYNPFKLNSEPHGFYMPPFQSTGEEVGSRSLGFGVQGTISADTGLFYLGAFGETVPSDSNRICLSNKLKDVHGMPVAHIQFRWTPDDLQMWCREREALAEMVEAFYEDRGIKLKKGMITKLNDLISSNQRPTAGSNHECGGARMGDDPTTSVVDPYNRVWGAPNVLVCDTACFPSIPHQNPTLTSMALALRAARNLCNEASSTR